MTTINELSPGVKLSLKGKLFELQKKLSLLDLERKMVEECPFQPHFYSNEAFRHQPGKQSNVSSSSAEDNGGSKSHRRVSVSFICDDGSDLINNHMKT